LTPKLLNSTKNKNRIIFLSKQNFQNFLFRNRVSGATGILPASYVEEFPANPEYDPIPDNDSFTSDSGKNEKADTVSEQSNSDRITVIEEEKQEATEPANGSIGV
jgi:hypothetical protein